MKRGDDADEMLPEYDFRGAVRGKFHRQYMTGRIEAILRELHLAEELIGLREARGFTQQGLAERLGVTQSAVAKLEAGESRNLGLRTLARYVAGLGGRIQLKIVAGPIPAQRRPRKTA